MVCSKMGCESSCRSSAGEQQASVMPSPARECNLCTKCKEREPISSIVKAHQRENFCLICFRSSLFGKFRSSIALHSMIGPFDKVLLAFSGGSASRVALQFLHEMQQKANTNAKVSKDKTAPLFDLGVAFINGGALYRSPREFDTIIKEIASVVADLMTPLKKLHVSSIGNIFAEDDEMGKRRVQELMNSVHDITGKEDLHQQLLMLSLQKVALSNGYNKLILGSCTSKIARHIISATVKGQGFSLPADIQYIDTRWEVPVCLPLRDCLAADLKMLCQLDSLKTIECDVPLYSGINPLVSSFVALLQEENPSKEHTIVRTAEKLVPFSFAPKYSKLRNMKLEEAIPNSVLCPICFNPLPGSQLQICGGKPKDNTPSWKAFKECCCESCLFQIVPRDPLSLEHFHNLLPEAMTHRMEDSSSADQNFLREQIKDCLLSDNDEATDIDKSINN